MRPGLGCVHRRNQGRALGFVPVCPCSCVWGVLDRRVAEQLQRLPTLLSAHLQLSLLALVLGLAFSLPLGVWVSRSPRREGPVLAIAGVIQTIPSLALLAFMVPLIGWFQSGQPGAGRGGPRRRDDVQATASAG